MGLPLCAEERWATLLRVHTHTYSHAKYKLFHSILFYVSLSGQTIAKMMHSWEMLGCFANYAKAMVERGDSTLDHFIDAKIDLAIFFWMNAS